MNWGGGADENKMSSYLIHKDAHEICLRVGPEIATRIGYRLEPPDEFCPEPSLGLFSLRTAPAYRRRGFATCLLHEVAAYAKEQGINYLILNVRHDNIPARKLYQKLGFKMVGVCKVPHISVLSWQVGNTE